MMTLDPLHKSYVHELKDLYSAENQAIDALAKMEAAASDKTLKSAFAEHRRETETHINTNRDLTRLAEKSINFLATKVVAAP